MNSHRRLRMLIALPVAVATALLSLLAAVPSSASTIIFQQDFNSGSLSPFSVSAVAPDSIEVAPRDDDPDNGVARLISATTRTVSMYRYGSWSGELSLRASIRLGDDTHRREAFRMHTTVNGSSAYQTIFTFNDDGTIGLLGQPSDRQYAPGQWYDLEAVIDHTNGTVQAWINDEHVLTDAPMLSSGTWSTTNSIRFTQTGAADGTGVAEVDDVVASVETGTDLPGELGGWGCGHTAPRPRTSPSTATRCRSSPSRTLPVPSSSRFPRLPAAVMTYGLADHRDMMTSPRLADGSHGFDFTWTGEDSGTSMRAFMNGVADDDLIFSTIPTNRRTLQNPAQKDAFPGEHFQRLRKVDPDDTTIYGSVYET